MERRVPPDKACEAELRVRCPPRKTALSVLATKERFRK